MELFALSLVLGSQSVKVDWRPKDVSLAELKTRAQFVVYAPADPNLKVSWKIVWIPKMNYWGPRPGRQAVLATIQYSDGKIMHVQQAPAFGESEYSNMMEIFGQGYLGLSGKEGLAYYSLRRGRTDLMLAGTILKQEPAREWLRKDLRPIR